MAANLERRAQVEKGTNNSVALPRSADRQGITEGRLEPIRSAIHAIAPGAEIILYGSRARGDAGPDSDWDLMILVDGLVDNARKAAIRNQLYEVEWTLGEVLTSPIYKCNIGAGSILTGGVIFYGPGRHCGFYRQTS